jgi:hypothetical protein
VITTHGATMALARKMLAAGWDDLPWRVTGSDGRAKLCGPQLSRLAKWVISETDAGLRMRRWVERDISDFQREVDAA